MNFALRIYRRLAQRFPARIQTGLRHRSDAARRGRGGRDRQTAWSAGLFRLIADIAIRVPIEYLSEMRGDMRYALRALLKSPGFALVGILSMGLGMGLTTNIFNSRWQSIFRELPAAANAQRLVMPEKPVLVLLHRAISRTKEPVQRSRRASDRNSIQRHLPG